MRRSLFGIAAVAFLVSPAGAADPTTCGHGTKIDFLDSPKEAAALAKKQEKLRAPALVLEWRRLRRVAGLAAGLLSCRCVRAI
jgi:hypothetical protein